MAAIDALNRQPFPAHDDPATGTNTVKPRLTPRRRPVVENDHYADFARRILAAYGRRVAIGVVEALTRMTALDDATGQAVTGLRQTGYSWAEIGAAARHHPPGRPATLGTAIAKHRAAPRAVAGYVCPGRRWPCAAWVKRRSTAQGLALRARIVLACAQGGSNLAVAARLGVHRDTVNRWRALSWPAGWMGSAMSRVRECCASSPMPRWRRWWCGP